MQAKSIRKENFKSESDQIKARMMVMEKCKMQRKEKEICF